MIAAISTNRTADDRIKGFTLIEVLIVIVILGILASIVVFAVQDLSTSTAAASCQTDYKTIESAEETYKAQMDAYAGTYLALETPTTGPDGSTVGPWIKEAPSSSYYTIAINSSGDITVATGTHVASLGNANCAYA